MLVWSQGKVVSPIVLPMVLVILALSSCTSSTIKVAFIGPLSGPNSSLGVEGRQGFEQGIREFSWKHPVDLVFFDDQGDAAKTMSHAKTALAMGIRHFVFHTTSGAGVQAVKETIAAGGFAFSATISAVELSGKKDLFFRTTLSNSIFGTHIGSMITGAPLAKPHPVVVIGDASNEVYVQAIFKSLSEVLATAGYPNPSLLPFDSRLEYSPVEIASKVEELKPRSTVIIANPLDSARLAQNIHKLGLQTQFYLSPWAVNNEFITNGGLAVEGTKALSIIELGYQSQDYIKFSEDYEKNHGKEPSYFAQYGYETAWILNDLFTHSRGVEPRDLITFMEKGHTFSGLVRDLKINEFGDGSADIFYYTVENGEFILNRK